MAGTLLAVTWTIVGYSSGCTGPKIGSLPSHHIQDSHIYYCGYQRNEVVPGRDETTTIPPPRPPLAPNFSFSTGGEFLGTVRGLIPLPNFVHHSLIGCAPPAASQVDLCTTAIYQLVHDYRRCRRRRRGRYRQCSDKWHILGTKFAGYIPTHSLTHLHFQQQCPLILLSFVITRILQSRTTHTRGGTYPAPHRPVR